MNFMYFSLNSITFLREVLELCPCPSQCPPHIPTRLRRLIYAFALPLYPAVFSLAHAHGARVEDYQPVQDSLRIIKDRHALIWEQLLEDIITRNFLNFED